MSFIIKFVKVGIVLSVLLILISNSTAHSIRNNSYGNNVTIFSMISMLVGIYIVELLYLKTLPAELQLVKPLISIYILKHLYNYRI